LELLEESNASIKEKYEELAKEVGDEKLQQKFFDFLKEKTGITNPVIQNWKFIEQNLISFRSEIGLLNTKYGEITGKIYGMETEINSLKGQTRMVGYAKVFIIWLFGVVVMLFFL